MNRHAREIGLERSTFRNATGYSAPDQKVTAGTWRSSPST